MGELGIAPGSTKIYGFLICGRESSPDRVANDMPDRNGSSRRVSTAAPLLIQARVHGIWQASLPARSHRREQPGPRFMLDMAASPNHFHQSIGSSLTGRSPMRRG